MGKEAKSGRVEKEFPLEDHEKLLLWRRRRRWKQGHAAEHFKVSLFTYKLTEYGKQKGFRLPLLNLGDIEEYEKCFILRKRIGKTQQEIASKVGCSLYWLRLQELGAVSAPRLIAYWKTQN